MEKVDLLFIYLKKINEINWTHFVKRENLPKNKRDHPGGEGQGVVINSTRQG